MCVCVSECALAPASRHRVCVRGGGAVHCGHAGPLSAGAAGGTPAARGGFWVQPPCPPPGRPRPALGLRGGNARLADVPGLYHVLISGGELFHLFYLFIFPARLLVIVSAVINPKGNGDYRWRFLQL